MRCKNFHIGVAFLLVSFVKFNKSLPITSKALENSSDQLIWQSSWYSQDERGEEANISPFRKKATKKLSAKSIFIIPSFEQSNAPKCSDGFKLDEKGNCINIKILSVNQDDQLVTRLQHIFPHHQTTDDSTDYDYPSLEHNDDDNKPTHFDLPLPLIPIIDDNDTSIYTIAGVDENVSKEPTIVQYGIEFDNSSFRDENVDNSTINSEQNFTTNLLLINDTMPMTTTTSENEIESKLEENVTTQSTLTTTTSLEYQESSTESHDSIETTEHVMSFNLESLEEKSEAEKAISNSSNPITIHLVDDYFDAMLLNDSLIIIDDTSSYSNVTETDYDITTQQEMETTTAMDYIGGGSGAGDDLNINSSEDVTVKSSIDLNSKENRMEELQHFDENETSKMHEYRYETVTEESLFPSPTLPPPVIVTTRRTPFSHFVRFPYDSNERKQLTISQATSQNSEKFRFPDDSTRQTSSSSFSWPRDNGYVSFWREQPLINDSKAFSSGFSRGIISSYNRHNHASYRGAYG